MIRFALVLLSLSTSSLFAQYWERTGGPGGVEMKTASISPSGDIYVFTNSLHRSTDKGDTWERLAPSMDFSSASNSDRIVWVPSGTAFMLFDSDLWRSADNCNTWENIKDLSTTSSIAVSIEGYLVIQGGKTVSVSTDEGVSWSSLSNLPSLHNNELNDIFTDKDSVLYVVSKYYIHRSTDKGLSWHTIESGLPVSSSRKTIYSPRPGLVLAAMDVEIYYSIDRGKTWTRALYASQHPGYFYSIVGISPDSVFAMTDDGYIFRSENGGKTWTRFGDQWGPGLAEIGIKLLADGRNLFALFRDTLLKRTIDTDTSWQVLTLPSATVLQLTTSPSGKVYAVTTKPKGIYTTEQFWTFGQDNGWRQGPQFGFFSKALLADTNDHIYGIFDKSSTSFFRSIDGGQSWFDKIDFAGDQFQMSMSPEYIYVVSDFNGVFRSPDRGGNWEQPTFGLLVSKLTAIGTADQGRVYVGGLQRFFRSNDHGGTWEEVLFPFIAGSAQVRAIAAHGSDVVAAVNRTGVYFSSDEGKNWVNHSQGLVSDTIYTLLNTPSGSVFLATTTGLFEYAPSTKTWTKVNEGKFNSTVYSLALGSDGRVYAGTNGDGVYRTAKSYGTWSKTIMPETNKTDDIYLYPNPASGELKIYYQRISSNPVSVRVYNLLGESVLREMESDGEISLDISALITGSYFLRIMSENSVRTIPFLIQR